MLGNIFKYFQKRLRRWRLYIILLVSAYVILILTTMDFRFDHSLLVLFVIATLFGKEKGKRLLVDCAPFMLFWIGYDFMRVATDYFRGIIHIAAPYKLEEILFGNLVGGSIPCFQCINMQYLIDGRVVKTIIDCTSGFFYSIHFITPLILAYTFWHKNKNRIAFYSFSWSWGLLCIAGLITFMLYPAAPPWYVYAHGFGQPSQQALWHMGAGSLASLDHLFDTNIFTQVWGNFNPNHFAAIPSLHGASPLLISFFLWKEYRYNPLIVALYPICVWIAAVYLNQHYIIDLAIGAVYALISYLIVQYFLLPRFALPYIRRTT